MDAVNDTSSQKNINTGGGDYAEGNIDKRQGTFFEEERSYKVHGLLNPYLGLRAFSYDKRTRYAGRDTLIQAAVTKLTALGAQRVLLFITGASGSGKSSFAQAGVLPALEQYYQQRQKTVRRVVFRPSQQPLALLSDALVLSGLPATTLDAQTFVPFIQTHTPDHAVNLIILDQFEELFTQSIPDQRDALFAILEHLPSFAAIRTHLIVTMRSDYLPELREQQNLWHCWHDTNIDLWAMTEADLKQAIQRPLQQHSTAKDKHFEDALLNKLAADAAVDATYLPLLQVTLEKLWNDGWLKLSAYNSLTDAIRQRAEDVYAYVDYDTTRQQSRTGAEQAILMQIFLDLVDVSLDNDARRDVRRRRMVSAVSGQHAQREALIRDLVAARLLSTSMETRDAAHVEVVDIIHESLIANWERLRSEIATHRTKLQQRVRFELALREWQAHMSEQAYLLDGVWLSEALTLDAHGDVALRSAEAQDLLKRSMVRQEERQREEARRLRRWLLRVTVLAAIVVIAAAAAVWFALTAQRNAAEARNRAVIAGAQAALSRNRPDTALALALVAVDVSDPLPQAEQVLVDATGTAAIQRFEGHMAGVRSVAFSPNGQTALSSADDTSLRVWDVASGQEIRRLDGHVAAVTSVAISRDGRLAVSGSADQTVRLWDIASGLETHVFSGHTGAVLSVAISPDGRSILSGSADGSVRLWDIANEQETQHLDEHAGSVYSVAFSSDGQIIVSGGQDRTVKLWDTSSGSLLATFTGHTGAVLSVAISSDATSILSGSGDSSVILWDRDNGHVRQRFTGHTDGVWSVAFSPDGQMILSGSRDQTVRLWDVRGGLALHQFSGHSDAIWSVAFSPDGQTILSGSADKTLRQWQVSNWQEVRRFLKHTSIVESVDFNLDGNLAISGSSDGAICLWDVATAVPVTCIQQADAVLSVAVGSNGRVLFGQRDGRLGLWNMDTHTRQFLFQHTDAIRSIAISPDGGTILFGAEDGMLCLMDVDIQQPQCWQAHPGVVTDVAFSPDGALALSGAGDRTLRLWDTASGEELHIFRGHTEAVWSVAFSPDGGRVLSGSADRTVRVWNVSNEQELHRFEGHQDAVRSVAVSADGYYVLSGAADGTLRLWDAASGQELRRLDGHRDAVTSVAFSPHGQQALSGSVDTTMRLWRLDPLADITAWIRTHRYVPAVSQAECAFYHLACDAAPDATPGLTP